MNVATTSQPLAPPAPASNGKTTTTASTPTFELIPLSRITPSKTNPRKQFDGPDFDELVESIRQNGVLQPVLVRTTAVPMKYELVAGERRYRASLKALAPNIPAMIRELTDQQVLEMQIVENLQRKDVTALEEAAGYAQLFAAMQKEQPKANKQTLVESIATRIGKSVRYVYARMKLNELPSAAQKLMVAGAISASHADELVRLQAGDQEKVLEFLQFEDDYGRQKKRDAAPAIRDLKKFIREQICIDLGKAPFDIEDAKLLPSAGACTSCPKMSGNNQLAFAGSDLGKKSCADSECYGKKRVALVQIRLGAAAKAEGVQAVPLSTQYDYHGSKRKKIAGVLYPEQYNDSGYAGGSYGPIKKGSCEKTVLGVYIDGEHVGKSVWVCAARGECKDHSYTSSSSRSGGATQSALRKKATTELSFRKKLFASLCEKLRKGVKPTRDQLAMVADCMFQRLYHPAPDRVREALGWEKSGASFGNGSIEKRMLKLSEAEVLGYILLMVTASELQGSDGKANKMIALAKSCKVDAGKILSDVKEGKAKKPAAKAQTSAKPKAKAKAAKGGR